MAMRVRPSPPDDRVARAMAAIPRAGFLPADQVAHAAEDRPLPIGHGQTNSQPSTVATMLWLLEVEPGHRVLDVGAGSGWTTALLATLVGATGLVVGVELEEDLAKAGSANLARTQQPWASIRTPDPGVIGDPGQGPYDRILVSAMAIELPIGLTNQMAPESVLVIPVGGRLMRIRRAGGTSVTERFGHYRFVPLR